MRGRTAGLAWIIASAGPAPAIAEPVPAVPHAVVRLAVPGAQPGIAACGFAFDIAGHRVELVLERGAEGAVASLSSPDALAVDLRPGDAAPDCTDTTGANAIAEADSDSLAVMFQRIAVSGATLCRRDDAGTAVSRAAGPLPNQVRALFLNCSGDLYRLER
ncbi:MAG: hypothetical protein AAF416_03130 [Pseudomonadota bacterium]